MRRGLVSASHIVVGVERRPPGRSRVRVAAGTGDARVLRADEPGIDGGVGVDVTAGVPLEVARRADVTGGDAGHARIRLTILRPGDEAQPRGRRVSRGTLELEGVDGDVGVGSWRGSGQGAPVLPGSAPRGVRTAVAALRAKADVTDGIQVLVPFLEIGALRRKKRFQICLRFALLRPRL